MVVQCQGSGMGLGEQAEGRWAEKEILSQQGKALVVLGQVGKV